MKILIGEDEDDISQIYFRILRRGGHQIALASDGDICLSLFNQHLNHPYEPPFDVVVLDHMMPRKNGADVAKEILKTKPDQRIVFISAYGEELLKKLEDFPKEVEFLSKPTTPQQVVTAVESIRRKQSLKEKLNRE